MAQCAEDYDTLNHYLNDTDKAGLDKRSRINTWYRPKQESTLAAPPMSTEEVSFYIMQYNGRQSGSMSLDGRIGFRQLRYQLRRVP